MGGAKPIAPLDGVEGSAPRGPHTSHGRVYSIRLRAMLCDVSCLLAGCGMSADWINPEKCAWVASDTRSPPGLQVGDSAIMQVGELRILGRMMNFRSVEESTVEDRASKVWKAYWGHRRRFRCSSAGILQRIRLRRGGFSRHPLGHHHRRLPLGLSLTKCCAHTHTQRIVAGT